MSARKPKSLGTLHHPSAEIESFSGRTGQVVLVLKDGLKTVRLEFDFYCGAKEMTDLARLITDHQRKYAEHERYYYEQLRDYTGYKPPDGKN